MKVIAVSDDGATSDVTEGVRVLYDTVIQSMDWGSGFLDNEEAMAILGTAQACGFTAPEEARNLFADYAGGMATWDLDRRMARYSRAEPAEKVKCAACGRFVSRVKDSRLPEHWKLENQHWRHNDELGAAVQSHPVQLWPGVEED